MLGAGGLLVGFVPNGDEAFEERVGAKQYDRTWGAVHPLAITSRFVQSMCARYGFAVRLCCPPYTESPPQDVAPNEPLNESEICFMACKL